MYRQSEKNFLSSNMSSRCPHSMVNFGPLTAKIGSGVWGTPANFNGLPVLATLLHGSQVATVSQTLRCLNRGRHLCSAGRPSPWALAYILVVYFLRLFLLVFSILVKGLAGKSMTYCVSSGM